MSNFYKCFINTPVEFSVLRSANQFNHTNFLITRYVWKAFMKYLFGWFKSLIMIFIEKKNINVFKADKNYSAHPLMELYVDFSVMWKNWKPCEVAKNIFFCKFFGVYFIYLLDLIFFVFHSLNFVNFHSKIFRDQIPWSFNSKFDENSISYIRGCA